MCQKFSSFLRNNNYVTASTSCNKEALELMKASDFDLILCDSELRNTYPVEFLLKIKSLQPNIPIISISDRNDVQTAVELMKSGAFYYLLKPINPEKLLDIVGAALKANIPGPEQTSGAEENQRKNKSKKNYARSTDASDLPKNNVKTIPYPYIKGVSKVARKLYKSIELVAPTDFTVIIQGETGTGKESVARMIHEHSKRADEPFVAVDCGILSKELAASELFGHEKGAFTGALQDRAGAFKLAHGGTLFLDEIGNLSYNVQLLLLRAIQEKLIRKVGSATEKPINVRLIVATNEDLRASVKNRKFREDLFHRLNEFTITVPPLREREEDLTLFIESFVEHASRRLNKEIQMPDEGAMEILKEYQWPGNIRELLNTIKKTCLMTPSRTCITEKYLPIDVKLFPKECESDFMLSQTELQKILQNNEKDNCEDNFAQNSTDNPVTTEVKDLSLKDVASCAELNKILFTLKKVQYNKSKAAEMLNINRKTLYNKLKKIYE